MILASVHARLFGGEPEPMMIGYHKILERIGVGRHAIYSSLA